MKQATKPVQTNFDVVELTKGDIDRLTEDERVYLAILCHVANECNMLRRLHLCTARPDAGPAPCSFSLALQSNFLLRTISAKLFELVRAMESLKKSTSDEAMANAIEQTLQKLKVDNETPRIAEYLRNETSNHVPVKAFRKNFRNLPPEIDYALYFHEVRFNSFFPLGEEVAFASRFHRHVASKSDEHDLGEIISSWARWINLSVDRLNEIIMSFVLDQLEAEKFATYPSSRKITVLAHMIGNPVGNLTAPIITVEQ